MLAGTGGVYRGREGLRRWSEEVLYAWATFDVSIVKVLDQRPDRVVIEERIRGRGRTSGAGVQTSLWAVYYSSNGLITRRDAFADREAALAAVDLGTDETR